MKDHVRIYDFKSTVSFAFDPIFADCNEENVNFPESKTIETNEVHFGILNEGNGKYILSVYLPESVIKSNEEDDDDIIFWTEGDLTLEQLESDIEQILERKELFI